VVSGEIDAYMSKQDLRFHPDYVDPILRRAIHALVIDKANVGSGAQLLIRAFSCKHAEHLCSQINGYDYDLECDRIGTKSDYGGRPDDENSAIKLKFCPTKDHYGNRPEPELDVLIQVGMASEGFDSINVSQLVDFQIVRLEGNANQTKQYILRGARWIPGVPDTYQICQLNVPTDHPILDIPNQDLMSWIDSNQDFSATDPNQPKQQRQSASSEDVIGLDPNWYKRPSDLKEVELLAVSRDDPFVKEAFNFMVKTSANPTDWTWDNPEAVDKFERFFRKRQEEKRKTQKDLNELGRHERIRKQVVRFTSIAAGKISRSLNQPYDEVVKRLYILLARYSGAKLGHGTSQQTEKSAELITRLLNELETGVVPEWAR
jgi:hypothetical protein